MNPVRLKPGSDLRSHVVLMGQPAGEVDAKDWTAGRARLAEVAHAAYDDLASRFDVILAEGAGSPAEINSRAGDFVNMGLAQHANLPTVVVGDIDRGGVFAAMAGTLAVLDGADQALIAGFIINKFRGDLGLLSPGLDMLTSMTRRPVFGVLPWRADLWLDSEDALDLAGRRVVGAASHRVAVVRLPRISNFTDVDALGLEPDLDVVFAASPRDVSDADLIVLPGTRATIADLAWLRSRGLDAAIAAHVERGKPVLGICGGYQMLGTSVFDPLGVEGAAGVVVDGLGLLDARTEFAAAKTLGLPSGTALGQPVGRYEIHHGQVTIDSGTPFPGGVRNGLVCGTLWHGSLEHDGFRGALLASLLERTPSDVSFTDAREQRLEALADLMEEHLDVDALLDLSHPDQPNLSAALVSTAH